MARKRTTIDTDRNALIPKKERPVRENEDDEDDEGSGDVYDLRTCHACETFLPLDAPGCVVSIDGARAVVCAECFEVGPYGVDDEEC